MTPNDAVPTTRIDEEEPTASSEEDARSDHPECPRCEGVLSGPRAPAHRPALSRTKPAIDVCARCGVHESFEAVLLGQPTPQSQWPVCYALPPVYLDAARKGREMNASYHRG